MSNETAAAPMPAFVTPTPMILGGVSQAREVVTRETPDPDRFLSTAKQVVVDNYNLHRDPDKVAELTTDMVYIVWFTKTLGNWKAIVASSVARGLFWEVVFNGHKNECYIDCYKKLKNVKVQLGEG